MKIKKLVKHKDKRGEIINILSKKFQSCAVITSKKIQLERIITIKKIGTIVMFYLVKLNIFTQI